MAAPGQSAPAYIYAHLLAFWGAPAASASVGLITGPAGKFAFFRARGPDGAAHDVAVPLPWTAGRYYFPFVYQLSPGVWGAWIYDHTAGSWTAVGQLSLPVTWGKLASTSTTTVIWFGENPDRCAGTRGPTSSATRRSDTWVPRRRWRRPSPAAPRKARAAPPCRPSSPRGSATGWDYSPKVDCRAVG